MSYENIIPADMEVFDVCVGIAVNAWQGPYREYEEKLGKELFETIFSEWPEAKSEAMKPFFKGDSEKHAYIVLDEGKIAGFITCRLDLNKKIGTICNNAVDPDFQGRGHGTRMYDFVLDVFRMAGMKAARVDTLDEDSYLPARKAYEKAGFNKKLKRVSYYMEL